jgi:hypothetical protein
MLPPCPHGATGTTFGNTYGARALARDTILSALQLHSIEVIVIAVTAHHFHVLARFPDQEPRHWAGIAKKESARALCREALAVPGGVWAVRIHCNPINDRPHQLQVLRHILDHAAEGGAIWRCPPARRPTPGPPAVSCQRTLYRHAGSTAKPTPHAAFIWRRNRLTVNYFQPRRPCTTPDCCPGGGGK